MSEIDACDLLLRSTLANKYRTHKGFMVDCMWLCLLFELQTQDGLDNNSDLNHNFSSLDELGGVGGRGRDFLWDAFQPTVVT